MYKLNEILDLMVREVFRQSGDMITEAEVKKYIDYILDTSSIFPSEHWHNYKWSLQNLNSELKDFSSTNGRGDKSISCYNDYLSVKFAMVPDRQWEIQAYDNLQDLEQKIKYDCNSFGLPMSDDDEKCVRFCIIHGKVETFKIESVKDVPMSMGLCNISPVYYIEWDNLKPYKLHYADNRSKSNMIYREFNGLLSAGKAIKELLKNKENADNIGQIIVETDNKNYRVEEYVTTKYNPMDSNREEERYIKFVNFNYDDDSTAQNFLCNEVITI